MFLHLKVVPETYSAMPYVHYVFLFLNFTMWTSLYAASTTDPGFLPADTEEYKLTLKQVRYEHLCSLSCLSEVVCQFYRTSGSRSWNSYILSKPSFVSWVCFVWLKASCRLTVIDYCTRWTIYLCIMWPWFQPWHTLSFAGVPPCEIIVF